MRDFEADTYGERIAAIYDVLYPAGDSAQRAAQLLHELAGDGTACELGVGTGRIAIPLARLGTAVSGIDLSPAMLGRLASKPGGELVDAKLGDAAIDDLGDGHALVYVVFNTFFAMMTQETQVRCFANVARSLQPGGRFLVEAFVPDPSRFDRGQRTTTTNLSPNRVVLDMSMIDVAAQTIESVHTIISAEGGIELLPARLRYAWPAELDLMARLAGFELEHRWADWDRTPFRSTSGTHVSVWRTDQRS